MSGEQVASEPFEPVVIGFTCNWCSYRAADLAGTARIKYAPNVRLIRLMCSGRLDPTFILDALARGADGVLISGCHPGECHYVDQNLNTLRRFRMLERILPALGIEPQRVQLVWASAAEGTQLAHEIDRMVEEVRGLGPLDWPARMAAAGGRTGPGVSPVGWPAGSRGEPEPGAIKGATEPPGVHA